MKRLHRPLLILACVFVFLLFLQQALAVAAPVNTEGATQGAGAEDGDGIQATERISIPYGFESELGLSASGLEVTAVGLPGLCLPAGEELTIAVTITQPASGVMATGTWMGSCTGELQPWHKTVAVEGNTPFIAGAAEACGLATTRDNSGQITGTDPWCASVMLGWYRYLPAIVRAE